MHNALCVDVTDVALVDIGGHSDPRLHTGAGRDPERNLSKGPARRGCSHSSSAVSSPSSVGGYSVVPCELEETPVLATRQRRRGLLPGGQ